MRKNEFASNTGIVSVCCDRRFYPRADEYVVCSRLEIRRIAEESEVRSRKSACRDASSVDFSGAAANCSALTYAASITESIHGTSTSLMQSVVGIHPCCQVARACSKTQYA